jgi:hypothetical protein
VLTHVSHHLSRHQREQEEEFQRKREENLRKAEEKTAKNRKKREKLKEKAKKKARLEKKKEKEQEQGKPAAGTIQRHPAFSLICHRAYNCASARTCLPTTCTLTQAGANGKEKNTETAPASKEQQAAHQQSNETLPSATTSDLSSPTPAPTSKSNSPEGQAQ